MKLKDVKRAEANERQDLYNSLTPAQRLARLDRHLGNGIGAVKQRTRLNKLITKGLAQNNDLLHQELTYEG